ncbi:MAG TPA: amidohydrolase family protein [Petrotogaceae bacterium]|nr:amidohydrolase family protein [Petrotogaceae bacterium]HQC40425.1 amidohydrolase family protein [Petrotogaceae bacterium]
MHILTKDGVFRFISTPINCNDYITPLITDSHMHLLSFGKKLMTPSLENLTLAQIKELIVEKLQEGRSPIFLRGWDESSAQVTRGFIDEITVDTPVILIRRCGHKAVVNKPVIDTVDFSTESSYVDPASGTVTENAIKVLYSAIKENFDIKKAFEHAVGYLTSKGYGFVHSDDLHGITPEELPFENSKLKIFEKVAVNSCDELFSFSEQGYFEYFRSVKIYVDGSFGARTALLSQKYNDIESLGQKVWNKDQIAQALNFCEEKNLHLAMHAIGDGAIDEILGAMEKVNPHKLHRIIHASLVRDDQLERIASHPVVLDVQPAFIESDKALVPLCLGERSVFCYRFKDFFSHSIPVTFSSDAPVETPDWVRDLSILSENGVSLRQSIVSMTYGASSIDGFERDPLTTGRYLVFKCDPFEKISIPQILG